ncbi:hypothetical protein L916_18961 [Phytophthora nicotianae]|uniref:Uncharacterized protein n=1 Tax=Phytophthora nicotianae TaxID=4792 RepID=W2I293_PHYNI|nr:hypothetical protein L916_18961 [Phytophthora nicotianae]
MTKGIHDKQNPQIDFRIPRHHKKGAKIQERDKVAAKKIRSFCIANESVYEAILSFLSNKALTKMQMITGTL